MVVQNSQPTHPLFEQAKLAHERAKVLSDLVAEISLNPGKYGSTGCTTPIFDEIGRQMNQAITQEKNLAHRFFLALIEEAGP